MAPVRAGARHNEKSEPPRPARKVNEPWAQDGLTLDAHAFAVAATAEVLLVLSLSLIVFVVS